MKTDFEKFVTEEMIKEVLEGNIEDLGNGILYEMCEKNFEHKNKGAVYAKTWIIGRTYSVALERDNSRKSRDKTINDDFYSNTIVPEFLDENSKIDEKIGSLKCKKLNNEVLPEIFGTYLHLIKITDKLERGTKRSFCSKYLHFHLPELFFIYDSRAAGAISKCKINISESLTYDKKKFSEISEYTKFFCKCLELRDFICNKWGEKFSPRQIDRLLLMVANHDLRRIV